MLHKLSRETLAERAARDLQAFIEAQALKPGNLLPPETQLATDLGVSRPIIREALKSLEGKGIIETVGGKGAMVKPPDSQSLQLFFQRMMHFEHDSIIDLMELRRGVECQSAGLAAERRTEADAERLHTIVEAMRQQLRSPKEYVALDAAFHEAIATASHNGMLFHLVKAMRDALRDTLHEELLRQQDEAQLEWVQAGHETIVAAIQAQDSSAAEQAMHTHFEAAMLSLIYSIRSEDGKE